MLISDESYTRILHAHGIESSNEQKDLLIPRETLRKLLTTVFTLGNNHDVMHTTHKDKGGMK